MKFKHQFPDLGSRLAAIQPGSWGLLLLGVSLAGGILSFLWAQLEQAIAPLGLEASYALYIPIRNLILASSAFTFGCGGILVWKLGLVESELPQPEDPASDEMPSNRQPPEINSFVSYRWESVEFEDSPAASLADPSGEATGISPPELIEQNPHILIIDNDTVDIQVLRQFLKFHNYTLSSLLDAKEALASLERGFFPDLILLDLSLPEGIGYRILETVRHQFSADQLPVILMSNNHQLEDILVELERGANDYLTKPIIKDELLACIHTHLENKKLKQETTRLTATYEHQLSQFLEALPVGVSVHKPDGSIFYFNRMAQRLLYQKQQLEVTLEQFSATYQIYRQGTEELYPTGQLPLVQALQGECATAEDLESRQDGGSTPLEVRGTPVYDEQGNPLYALVTVQDITERKRAEQILADYSHQLALEVSQRTTELAAANTQLQIEIQERKQVEQALQIANQELQRLINIDGLTQVANRRCFDERLQWEWQRLSRAAAFLSLILFDVDYFKRYNDFYGHQAGDRCLTQVAQAANGVVNRSADLVARYGGEEFAVILPGTNLQGAIAVAENIQLAIRSLEIPHPKSEVNSHLTLSLGIASHIPTLGSSSQALLANADQALYRAKQQGRNRYCTPFDLEDHSQLPRST